MEHADLFVVLGHRTLALEDADLDGRLVIGCRREDLALAGRNRGIGLDQFGHHTAEGLDTQRKRGHIQQEDIFHVTGQHTALDRGAHGHDFVGVHAAVRLLAEEGLHQFLDLRDTGGTTHEQDLVNIGRIQLGILEGLAARLDGTLEQIVAEHFELGAGKGLHQVFGDTVHRHDVRQVDFRGILVGQFDLRLLGRLFQTLQGHRILLQVDAAVLGSELAGQPVDDNLVEVIAAQVGISVGGFHLDHTAAQFQDGDIEGTAAQVIDRHLHILVHLVQTVGKGRGRRLVDDTFHVQTGNLASLFGGLTLRVGEVCRHGDHRLGHFLAEVLFRRLLHFLQHHGGNLLRRIETPVDVHPRGIVVATHHLIRYAGDLFAHLVIGLAHEPLDREDGLFRVGDSLTLGRVTDFALATVGKSHDGRGGALTLVVDDNGRLVAFHDRHARIGGAQVDTNDFSHNVFLLFYFSISPDLPQAGQHHQSESRATKTMLTIWQNSRK